MLNTNSLPRQPLRLVDWEVRLAAVTEKHLHLAGEWGKSDCLITVADAIRAVIGKDHARMIRGKYTTELGAAKIMKRRGFATVEDVLASRFPPVGRLLAQRGDVGVVERNGVISAGYVTEYGFAVKSETGLEFIPQTEIRSAFAIGRRD